VTEENPKPSGTPRDLTDAELDALLASADRELLEAVKGAVDLEASRDAILREIDNRELPFDAAMKALYRQLDEQDLPGDPAFDVEEGLRDVKGRRMLYGDSPPDMDGIHAAGEELAAGRITGDEAYERFLKAGCLPSGARLHLRLRSGQ
jgi:hypothetical protein